MFLGCLLVALAATGCGRAPQAISGRVTLDGKPLSEAAIQFIPQAPGIRKSSCEVQNGRYQLPREGGLLPGEYRVDLVDLPPLSHGRALRRPFPARYSENSPLSIQVEAGGPTTFDFRLTSEP